MFRLNIEDTVASKGIAIVEYPFKKVIEFFELPDSAMLISG